MAGQPPPIFFTSPTWQMNGVNVFTMNLARGLQQRRMRATVVLTSPAADEPIPMARPDDIDFVELDTAPDDPITLRWRALCRLLEQEKPCVYIPNYDWHTSCVAPRLSSSIVVVGVVHSDDPRHYEHFDRLGDTWNAVVAVSDRIGRRIEETRRADHPPLTVIPIGVEVATAPPRTDRRVGPLPILYAGLLNRFQKRIFDVVAITRKLQSRGVPFTLTFAGGGDDESELRAACDDLVDGGFVRFAGILDRDELHQAFATHDVFIMTSEFEGLPNALLEAMGHSMVPVVTDIESGIPEVVTAGENGLVAPVGDIEAFVAHLTALQADPQLVRRLGDRARTTVLEGPYNVEHMVDKYEQLFKSAALQTTSGEYHRIRGPVRPPADLGPLWRHHIPESVKVLWRRIKGAVID